MGFSPFKLFFVAINVALVSSRSPYQQVEVAISNDSNQQVVLDWYNPSTGEAIEFHRLRRGERIDVKSFQNHSFILHYDNETCTDRTCHSAVITVHDSNEQVVRVTDDLVVEHMDINNDNRAGLEATDIVTTCKDLAARRLERGMDSKLVMGAMKSCIEDATASTFQKLHEKEMFQSTLRESISDKLENYTCTDKMMETSEAAEHTQWTYQNVTHRVHLLHDRQASKIHMLEDFITAEECDAITAAAAPKLHRGTVADGKGGSRLSDHRKAMQAGVRVPWEKEEEGNPIAAVMRRLYAYTNHATGFGIDVEGQEDIMSIQYFGRGEGDEAPDQYRPHCDGDCNSLPHKRGGRVATMVMYCDTTDLVGGGTNFGKAGVFVKPKVGAAAFFSYLDPETHIHEPGFTSHSGCPVVEGRKRIAVHWMRIGVDKENPWTSFDTNNIKKSECDDYD